MRDRPLRAQDEEPVPGRVEPRADEVVVLGPEVDGLALEGEGLEALEGLVGGFDGRGPEVRVVLRVGVGVDGGGVGGRTRVGDVVRAVLDYDVHLYVEEGVEGAARGDIGGAQALDPAEGEVGLG